MNTEQAQASFAQNAIGAVMTLENAIQILKSRKLITEPGKIQVKVTNVTPFDRTVAGGDTILTNIVNFAAMTPYQFLEAKKLLKAGNYQEATNQNLTSSRRIGMDWTPKKGDMCEIVVDYVALRDYQPWANPEGADPNNSDEDSRFPNGRIGQQGLLVVSVQEIPLTKVANVSISLEDFAEETTEASLVDPNTAAIANREASIDSATAKGAGAEPAKVANKQTVEQPEGV
jgi:hypothetical protein